MRITWSLGQSLTIAATDGDGTVSKLGNLQAPTSLLHAANGHTLQFSCSGLLGPSKPDNDRLVFTADNSADIDGGTLEIYRSHVIFQTGSNEMLVHNGGTLSVTGSEYTVLEAGTLHLQGGTLQVDGGENTAKADKLLLDGDPASLTLSGFGKAVTPAVVLGARIGVFLTIDISDDKVLAPGTEFVIVDYQDGQDLQTSFIRVDYQPLHEGDLISYGLNTYQILYHGGESSQITLTVADANPDSAQFHVNKAYSDSNTTPVDVTLTCNGGLPLEQSFTISPDNPVTFTLTDFVSDTVTCEVTESGSPEGYVSSFYNHDTESDTSCVFDPVHLGNVYSCEITNTAANAQFTVTKQWVMTDGVSEAPDDVEVNVSCSADIVSVDGQPVANPDGTATVLLDDGESSVLGVDTSTGAATCTATETITQSGVEVSYEGCTNAALVAGSSEDCTITNTVFFEGIPTLDRYGLALLVLLTMGVGLVYMRRYA